MKKFLVAVLALAMVLAVSMSAMAAGSDDFNRANTTAGIGGNWTRGDSSTSWINILDNAVVVKGGASGTGKNIGNTIDGINMSGLIHVDFQAKGDHELGDGFTTWAVTVDSVDMENFADGNIAKYYGATDYCRGRIASSGSVTGSHYLTSNGAWDNLKMAIDTNAGTVEFFQNGVSWGVLNNGQAGKAIGRISIVQINNAAAGAELRSMQIDNFSVTAVPEPGSVLALCSGLIGMVGFARRRRA